MEYSYFTQSPNPQQNPTENNSSKGNHRLSRILALEGAVKPMSPWKTTQILLELFPTDIGRRVTVLLSLVL